MILFKNDGAMTMTEILANELNLFDESKNRKWMLKGDSYYKAENDIIDKELPEAATFISNNRLAHAYMKKLVDEKVHYLLAKEYSFSSDKDGEAAKLKDALGVKFPHVMLQMGYEASNKGVGWLHVYINKAGELRFIRIPSEQCCPIWSDSLHEELEGMIRYYVQEVYEGTQKKEVTHVEYWTPEGVTYYVRDGNMLILDSEKYLNMDGDYGHYVQGQEQKNWKSWGRVPYIAFKNNDLEYGDLRFVKSLIDSYDNARSKNANYIDDLENLIYVLKNYGGTGLDEFMADLKKYRAVKVDDDGGVDTLTPDMDIEASKQHFEQLDKDIIKFGQGVLVGQDTLGTSPSGIALKFLYSGLDLKCNSLEREFKAAFVEVQYFVNHYLQITNKGALTSDVEIIFNRDIAVNEGDAITQCMNSQGIISDETIIANHPWVKNPEEELKKVTQEKAEKVKQQQKAFGLNGEGSNGSTAGGVVDEE